MKIVTSATVFTDSVGTRLSVTYSEVDETSGKITGDNMRANKVVVSAADRETANTILNIAQAFVDTL